jgi:hypothetical protein
MSALAALPWALAVYFYLEAGRRNWQVMWLTTPQGSKEPLAIAVRTNTVPFVVKLVWTLFWAPILVVAWVVGKFHAPRML